MTSSQAQTFKRICTLWRLKWSAPAPSVLQLPWGCLGEVRGAGFLQPHRWGAPARQCLTLPRTDRLPPGHSWNGRNGENSDLTCQSCWFDNCSLTLHNYRRRRGGHLIPTSFPAEGNSPGACGKVSSTSF